MVVRDRGDWTLVLPNNLLPPSPGKHQAPLLGRHKHRSYLDLTGLMHRKSLHRSRTSKRQALCNACGFGSVPNHRRFQRYACGMAKSRHLGRDVHFRWLQGIFLDPLPHISRKHVAIELLLESGGYWWFFQVAMCVLRCQTRKINWRPVGHQLAHRVGRFSCRGFILEAARHYIATNPPHISIACTE